MQHQLTQPEFWRELNPQLQVSDFPFRDIETLPICPEHNADQQMRAEGHFIIDAAIPDSLTRPLADAIKNIVAAGLPPVFCFVYDDYWQMYKRIASLVSPVIGADYRVIDNQWAWHLPPSTEYSGFTPHRDGRCVDYTWFPSGSPVRSNGRPDLMTVWIALSNITTKNSCMHVLPSSCDPNISDHQAIDIASRDIPEEAVQCVRALPCNQGSILGWNPNVLHWGSRSSSLATEPRISFASYLVSADMPATNKSFGLSDKQPLSFGYRLRQIGQAMFQYKDIEDGSTRSQQELVQLCAHYVNCKIYDLGYRPELADS